MNAASTAWAATFTVFERDAEFEHVSAGKDSVFDSLICDLQKAFGSVARFVERNFDMIEYRKQSA